MIRKFVKEKYYCGLDIGSQSVKAALTEVRENTKPVLVGVYESRTAGYRDASVTDLEDLTECIQRVISGLTRKTRIKIREVELGVGGDLIQTRSNHAAIPLVDRGHKVITGKDIRKIHSQSKLLGTRMDEMVVHHFPESYRVDDVNIATNPIGLYGRKLELNSQLLVVKEIVIKNLTTALHQAGYDMANVFYNSYASGYACLKDEQKEAGCVLIDIGSSLSSILLYKAGRLVALSYLPMGGQHITKNIAQELSLTFDLAEDIKKSYGSLLLTENQGNEDILIKRDDGYLPIKKREIVDAINPVCAQLVADIVTAVKGSPLYDQMNHGIVLVGGGALLSGLPERLEQDLRVPIQVGRIHIAARKLNYAPKFAASVGLTQIACAAPGDTMSLKSPTAKGFSRLLNRVTELYQEYF